MIFITFTNGQYQISVNPSKVLFVTKVSDLRSEIVFGPQHFIQVDGSVQEVTRKLECALGA